MTDYPQAILSYKGNSAVLQNARFFTGQQNPVAVFNRYNYINLINRILAAANADCINDQRVIARPASLRCFFQRGRILNHATGNRFVIVKIADSMFFCLLVPNFKP